MIYISLNCNSSYTEASKMSPLAVIICTVLVTLTFGNPTVSRKPRLLDNRIVGGEDTRIEDHPYQLSLQLYGEHFCGASIISSKWAVTAAHCLGGMPMYYRVSAGSSNKYDGRLYEVKNLIPHPQFNEMIIDYDIALIEMVEEFEFSEVVQPIGLPNFEAQPGLVVNVTGWGTLWQDGSSSRLLQNVAVPIISRGLCGEAYSVMNEITPRMICAGDFAEGGRDSCQGDSGGPLAANNILYGIVSWGYGCAQPHFPGVYTNVAELREWVKEISGV